MFDANIKEMRKLYRKPNFKSSLLEFRMLHFLQVLYSAEKLFHMKMGAPWQIIHDQVALLQIKQDLSVNLVVANKVRKLVVKIMNTQPYANLFRAPFARLARGNGNRAQEGIGIGLVELCGLD